MGDSGGSPPATASASAASVILDGMESIRLRLQLHEYLRNEMSERKVSSKPRELRGVALSLFNRYKLKLEPS